MNPEPLTKEKIDEIEDVDMVTMEAYDRKIVDYKDVKSAVNWLLKEIEKELKEVEEPQTLQEKAWVNGFIQGLGKAKDLIKKAFSGVIEE